jgi:hypothetical protein
MSKEQKLNILILYHLPYYSHLASNEYLEAFSKNSKNNVRTLDCYRIDIPDNINLEQFDVIIVHYSVIIVSDAYLTAYNRLLLKQFRGLKVLIIQDEYRWINQTVDCMRFIDFDVLLTCVPDGEVEKIYPSKVFPSLKKVNVLTGYVSQEMQARQSPDYEKRELDIVYRAHKISAWYGSLGREKWEIAEKFNKYNLNLDHPLKSDVSYRTEDRLYNERWIEFLMSSKAALGVESGASIADYTDELRKNVERYEKLHPLAAFEEIKDLYFKDIDGNLKLNQISPRHFEYASCRTLMVLYEGEYSGILKPWVHYLPLKKDFSNFAQLSKSINDKDIWQELTQNAFNGLIIKPDFTFALFIKKLNKLLISELTKRNKLKEAKFVNNKIAEKGKTGFLQNKLLGTAVSLISKHFPLLREGLKVLLGGFLSTSVKNRKIFYAKKGYLDLEGRDVLCFSGEEHKVFGSVEMESMKVCNKCRWAFKGYGF